MRGRGSLEEPRAHEMRKRQLGMREEYWGKSPEIQGRHTGGGRRNGGIGESREQEDTELLVVGKGWGNCREHLN